MGKESRRENRRNRGQQPVSPDKQRGSYWFIAVVALMLVAGGAVVVLLASQHESVAGVKPEAGIDHWHDAYVVNACGTNLPPSTRTEAPNGIHTHGRGLVHIHPTNPQAAGPNADLANFIEAIGAELTDDTYTPGPGEDPTVLSEEEGCDGEPATLQLAYWADAWSDGDPVVITENLTSFRFDDQRGGAITLALLPEGEEIPKPPPDRINLLEQTNGGRNPSGPEDLPATGTEPETDTEADTEADADAES